MLRSTLRHIQHYLFPPSWYIYGTRTTLLYSYKMQDGRWELGVGCKLMAYGFGPYPTTTTLLMIRITQMLTMTQVSPTALALVGIFSGLHARGPRVARLLRTERVLPGGLRQAVAAVVALQLLPPPLPGKHLVCHRKRLGKLRNPCSIRV